MALENLEFKDQIGLILGRAQKREGRRRREEEKEESRQRYGTWIFGMETHLDYESYEIRHGSLAL